MKWDRGHRSQNVEDLRGQSGGGRAAGGAGGLALLSMLYRSFGIKGLLLGGVAAGALYMCGGEQGRALLGIGSSNQAVQRAPDPAQDELMSFVQFVFDDVQNVWQQEFPSRGKQYKNARMRVFTGAVNTGCGRASAAVGPFYCPADQYVYIDLGFYRQLRRDLGAPGDFAQAYVIAHEVAHHVQNINGLLKNSRDKGADSSAVRSELQADCLAGVWAHSTGQRDLLERGDIEEAMRAAKSIGDDALQARQGEVRPESWTHGSSEQRMRWFNRGLTTGKFSSCDTFSARIL